MADEITTQIALLLARLDGVVEKQADLTARLDRLTETLTSSYVPRGEYLSDRRGDDRRFTELEDDNKNAAGFRRQVAAGFVVGFLLMLMTLVLTLARTGVVA